MGSAPGGLIDPMMSTIFRRGSHKHAIRMSTSHIFVAYFVCFAQFTNIKLKLQSSLSTEIDLFDDSDKE